MRFKACHDGALMQPARLDRTAGKQGPSTDKLIYVDLVISTGWTWVSG